MNYTSFTIRNCKKVLRVAAVCLLIFTIGSSSFAQFKGAPVRKERLVKALRSGQFQTRDIVTIINSNGVDFNLTAEAKKTLVEAGARPEVIRAVSENSRFSSTETVAKSNTKKSVNRRAKIAAPDYDELLDQALLSYQDRRNPIGAARYLQTAIKMNPGQAAAYQMLGFVNLYGLNNPVEAQKYMRQAIEKGGSAVFRVFHDDNGNFMRRCAGSLFISPESIRFESDDNVHTFETSTVNIDKIKLDTESSRIWKNHTIFKVYLKIGKDKAKFRFAPITGNEIESQMVARFVQESRFDRGNFIGLAMNISK